MNHFITSLIIIYYVSGFELSHCFTPLSSRISNKSNSANYENPFLRSNNHEITTNEQRRNRSSVHLNVFQKNDQRQTTTERNVTSNAKSNTNGRSKSIQAAKTKTKIVKKNGVKRNKDEIEQDTEGSYMGDLVKFLQGNNDDEALNGGNMNMDMEDRKKMKSAVGTTNTSVENDTKDDPSLGNIIGIGGLALAASAAIAVNTLGISLPEASTIVGSVERFFCRSNSSTGSSSNFS
jgi:hypothetical protein